MQARVGGDGGLGGGSSYVFMGTFFKGEALKGEHKKVFPLRSGKLLRKRKNLKREKKAHKRRNRRKRK